MMTEITKNIGSAAIRVLFACVCAAAVVAAGTAAVSAEEDVPAAADIEVTVLADVRIEDARVVLQENRAVGIAFRLFNNGDLFVSNIRYAVWLAREDARGGVREGLRVYDESPALAPGAGIEREILYEAPLSVSGPREIMVEARTAAGLPLSLVSAGEVVFSESDGYVAIESCGDISGNEEEGFFVSCEVVNTAQDSVPVSVSVSVFSGSEFGAPAPVADFVPPAQILLSAGERRTVTVPLPAPASPERATARIGLERDGVAVSGAVFAEYPSRAESSPAEILSVSLDRSSYAAGDTAVVEAVVLLPIPDDARESEFFVELRGGDGRACGGASAAPGNGDDLLIRVKIPVEESCENISVFAFVRGASGSVLASYAGDFASLVSAPSDAAAKGFFADSMLALAIALAVILFLLALGHGRRRGGSSLAIALIFAGFAAAQPAPVHALTWGVSFPDVSGNAGRGVLTADLNKYIYNPGETVTASLMLDSVSFQITLSQDDNPSRAVFSAAAGLQGGSSVRFPNIFSVDPNDYPSYPSGSIPFFNTFGTLTFSVPNNSSSVVFGPSFNDGTFYNPGSNARTLAFTVTPPAPPSPPPVSVSLFASPSGVSYGSRATLYWSSSNADSCTASGAWSGAKPLSGSQSTGVLTSGRTYTLTCTGPGGSASRSVTVSVGAPPRPSVSLNPVPSFVPYGGASTLYWTAQNARSCRENAGLNIPLGTSGSVSTGALYSDSLFRVTCTGPGGSASRSVVVRVGPPPKPTASISVSPNPAEYGTTATISWSSSNADSCTASGAWSGAKPLSGSQSTGVLTSGRTYTLTCTGAGGSETNSAVLNLLPAISVLPDPSWDFGPVNIGSSATRSFTVSNIGGGVLEGSVSVSEPFSCVSGCSYAVSGSPTTVTVRFAPRADGAVSRSVVFSGGGSATRTVSGTGVFPPPSVNISADSGTVSYLEETTLRWSSSNADSCTASGAWSGTKSLSGSEATGPIIGESVFGISCTGRGGTASDSVSVNVFAPVCGNGVCEQPSETPSSCAADCPFTIEEF